MRLGVLPLLALQMLLVLAAMDASQVKELVNPSTGLIHLNDRNFKEIVGGPRDYTIAVLLTAEGPHFGCGFCKLFGPVFGRVASSWNMEHPEGDGLFFGVADISDSQGTYQSFGLTHAPSVFVFKPIDKPAPHTSGYDVYQFPQTEEQVGPFREHLRKNYGFDVVIKEPLRWDRIGLTIGTVIAFVAVLRMAKEQVQAVLRARQVWMAVSLVAVLMFTAGHMFNMIRRTPYIVGDGKGGAMYFVPGHSNQVAVETQIIAIVYAILAFSTIALIVKVPRLEQDSVQGIVVSALVMVVWFTFSFLVDKFRVKNGGYPYKIFGLF